MYFQIIHVKFKLALKYERKSKATVVLMSEYTVVVSSLHTV